MTDLDRLQTLLDAELERRRLTTSRNGLKGAFGPSGDVCQLQAYLYWYAAEAELVVDVGSLDWVDMPSQDECLDRIAILTELGAVRDPGLTALLFAGMVLSSGSVPEVQRGFEFCVGLLRALSQCVYPGTEWPEMYAHAGDTLVKLRDVPDE